MTFKVQQKILIMLKILDFFKGDSTNLKFDEGEFNIVYSYVLHHIGK